MTNLIEKDGTFSDVETIKRDSRYLRGTLRESLADALTGAIADADTQVIKFHGIYQQDDRDARADRKRRRLEPAWQFMIRVRVAGGILNPAQWLALDAIADAQANGTLRLTTRQAVQLHGVLKTDLQPAIRAINDSLLDSIAGCGDVNRNVMCSPNPVLSPHHRAAYELAVNISAHLTPRTTAYHEIWLNGEKLVFGEEDHEPIYGPTYLPRKFKIGVAVPPRNDVDIFTQDLGFIAVVRNGEPAGYNVTVGGGMGVTHGDAATYPRLADVIGFCRPEQAVEVAKKVVTIQRDYGDRTNRKHARLKYTIADRGVDWFREELHARLGWQLEAARPFRFVSRGDRFGWVRSADGNWHLTLLIPEGRVRDTEQQRLRTALRAVAAVHEGDFRITPSQNLIIAGVSNAGRAAIDDILRRRGVQPDGASRLRQNATACVAFPSCPLAMAEAERYLPDLLGKVGALLERHGLSQTAIVLRVSGCPNGCSRPYVAEIALVGKAPGRYSLYLGGDFQGQRLNALYSGNITEDEILAILDGLFARFARERRDGERFGDFIQRIDLLSDTARSTVDVETA